MVGIYDTIRYATRASEVECDQSNGHVSDNVS